MIKLHGLLFPTLIRVGETSFKSWSDSEKAATSLYQLSWDPVDKIKTDRWNKGDFPGTLPEKYDSWVKDMTFAIPQHYLMEVRRTARLSVLEWCTSRPFDTMVREICLEPAVSYAYVSFRLVADCLYDSDTNYFYRGNDKILAPQAMLYKFWSHQTGRGLLRAFSRFDKIWMADSKSEDVDDSKRAVVIPFMAAIHEFEKKLEEAHLQDSIKGIPVEEQPSKLKDPDLPVKMSIEKAYLSSFQDFQQKNSASLKLEDTLLPVGNKNFALRDCILTKSSQGNCILKAEAADIIGYQEGAEYQFPVRTLKGEYLAIAGTLRSVSSTPPLRLEMGIKSIIPN